MRSTLLYIVIHPENKSVCIVIVPFKTNMSDMLMLHWNIYCPVCCYSPEKMYVMFVVIQVDMSISVIIMLSVNFFCNIISYDILAYITKSYIALIYYAKIVHLLCQFHVGKIGFSAVCQAIYSYSTSMGESNLSIYYSRHQHYYSCYCFLILVIVVN